MLPSPIPPPRSYSIPPFYGPKHVSLSPTKPGFLGVEYERERDHILLLYPHSLIVKSHHMNHMIIPYIPHISHISG